MLLGANGAGKSTLLKVAAGVLRPSGGNVTLGTLEAYRRHDRAPYRRRVAWLPQDVRGAPGRSAREQVAYAGWLKGLRKADAWDAAARALRTVGLTEQANESVATLSGGMRQRVGLAQALVHNATVLLLDEPTVGLDPVQRGSLRRALLELPPWMTVVVSTHQVDDLSELFRHVVVMHEGKVRYSGTVEAFLARGAGTAVKGDGSLSAAERAYVQVVEGSR